jgi:uncharacterized protein YndB with AHSA1/START domain
MKPLINSVALNRSPEEVFDYLCDLKNELSWNPDMLLAEQLTEGSVGEGTCILCQWKGGPKMECTYTKFDRPRYWEAYAASKVMDIAFACKVEPTEGGARITASMTLLPKGLFRIIAPFIRMAFQKEEQKNMEKIRKAVENLSS